MKYGVIGLGELGYYIVETLVGQGVEVLAIDKDMSKVNSVKDIVTQAVQADSTSEETLIQLGFKDINTVVVAIGKDLQANILTTAILKSLEVKNIISRATSALHARILREVGAHKVINPARDMGIKVARQMLWTKFEGSIALYGDYMLAEIKVPTSFVGKTIAEAKLREKFRANVIAIKTMQKLGRRKEDPEIITDYNGLPSSTDRLGEGQILQVVGKREDVDVLASMD